MKNAEKTRTSMHAAVDRVRDPYLWPAVGLGGLFLATLPILLATIHFTYSEPELNGGSSQVAGGAVNSVTTPVSIAGLRVYTNACAVCHGQDGEGLLNLGKPVRNSAYVQESTDEELFELIAQGRPPSHPDNTSGILMPPRGAVGLSDAQIHDVIGHLRAMQDLSQPTVSMDPWILEEGESGDVAVMLTEHPGYELYVASCAACHGEGGEGIEELGLPMTTSGFIRGETDQGLVNFIKTGRPMWDPNNVTGLDMPPKGGNPAITDDQLVLIVDYLRAIQEAALGGQ